MSMLRSSKFFRYFISVARNIVITRPELDNTLVKRSANWVNYNLSYSTQSVNQPRIEKFIQKLDQDVRRSGRITWKELEEVFNAIKHSRHATNTQSLMIIRCCGNLVPDETPELKTKLVNEIWSTFEKIGVPLDISHYNSLLRVYLENEHQFSPSEFLADLHTKGVEPNRVTYQRLIAAYCQRGDIEGATRILEFMKEKQMPVNESVFNSLIMGHFQADDKKSAIGILSVMKQANIPVSSETYTTLMCGYAKNGDYADIEEILTQCEGQDIEISDKDILEVMYSLAVNGHNEHLEKLADKLKKLPGFNQDAKNVILRLLVKGKDEAALMIFRTMTPVSTGARENMTGNFLIKQMVKSGRPIENILNVCNELKASGENDSGIFVATEASLVNGNPEMSLKLLTILSKEHEVCHHYYWPVLVQYGKTRNIKGMTDTLFQMIEEVGQPINGETLRDYVVPYIPQSEEGVLLLKQGGVPLATGAAALIYHLLSKNDIKGAAQIGMQFKANYTSPLLCRNVVNTFINTNDLESFITLVRVIVESAKEEDNEIAGKILLDLVESLRKNRIETVLSVLKAYLESGLGVSSLIAEEIQNRLSGSELTSDVEELLTKLTSSDLTPRELKRPSLMYKKFVDESLLLKSIKIAADKGDPAWGLKRQLLSEYCLDKNLEKAEELKKEMANDGFEFQTGMNVMMMDLYVHHEKLKEALEYYNKIFENDVEIDPGKILKLAALMVKNNMIEEAVDMLQKRKINADAQSSRAYSLNSLGWRILNILAENKDPDNLQKLFNVLLENNFIVPNNALLGPLIKVHLLRDDVDSALNVFEECCTKYRATPWKNDIACRLIQKEDPVALQKLTDLSTQIHGEINSLYDLVLSFVECGRIRQARKILETPGLRARTYRLNSACIRYDNEGHVMYLENLVEATKDLAHIDRADIYYHLLSSYCKSDEVDKALGLWTQMQDEDVQPTDQLLLKLGNLLKEHNRPVPFSIPTVKEASSEAKKQQSIAAENLPLRMYRSAINSKNVEEALNILKRLNVSELSSSDRSKLIMLLLTNGQIGEATKICLDWFERKLKINVKVLSYLINVIAKTGDVDSLNAIGNHLGQELKKMTSFNNRLTHCMVEAKRAEEVFEIWESKLKAADTPEKLLEVQEQFPRGGMFSVFESASELVPRFEEMARLYREKGIMEPTNILWAHYVITGDSLKAKETWSFLIPTKKLLFQPILNHARKTLDLQVVTELLSLCKSTDIETQSLGIIYSAAVDISLMLKEYEEAEKFLEKGIEECSINYMNRSALLKMKRHFEANGKIFKYDIPSRRKGSTASSSSSDSDSDKEKTIRKVSH